MPEALVIGRRYGVTFVCRSGDQIAVLRRYYRTDNLTGGGTTTDKNAADYLATAFAGVYKAVMWNTAEFVGCSVVRMSGPIPFPIPQVSLNGAGVGTGGATALPKQTAGIISLLSDFRGKKYRGRQYVPFAAEDHNTASGFPTAAYQISLIALGSTLVATQTIPSVPPADTIDFIPIIWDGVSPSAFADITSFIQRDRWGTQRRRGDYGAANKSPL